VKKKILITGFEPFDQDVINISGEWIKRQNIRDFDDRNVSGIILPVTFHQSFDVFKKSFENFDPDLVLLTGYAKSRLELTAERIGINWMDARIPDNNGHQPKSKKIRENAPDGLFTTIEWDLLQSISPDLKLSTSAGEYVCNYLLFEVLHYVRETKHRAGVTFFHLPGHGEEQIVFKQLDTILEKI
jgi:pyroglutamyl-peptidase